MSLALILTLIFFNLVQSYMHYRIFAVKFSWSTKHDTHFGTNNSLPPLKPPKKRSITHQKLFLNTKANNSSLGTPFPSSCLVLRSTTSGYMKPSNACMSILPAFQLGRGELHKNQVLRLLNVKTLCHASVSTSLSLVDTYLGKSVLWDTGGLFKSLNEASLWYEGLVLKMNLFVGLLCLWEKHWKKLPDCLHTSEYLYVTAHTGRFITLWNLIPQGCSYSPSTKLTSRKHKQPNQSKNKQYSYLHPAPSHFKWTVHHNSNTCSKTINRAFSLIFQKQ